MKLRAVAAVVALLGFFAVWTAATSRSVLVTYHNKYSIFSRNYRQFGLAGTHGLPHYNFALTDPPSGPYVSNPPLVPLLMYAASRLAGDRPSTYHGVIIAFHLAAFLLLWFFARRRWGDDAALLILGAAVLTRYSMTYGDAQTPEFAWVIGSAAAVFCYFEWIERWERRWLALCVAAYLFGLASDYRTLLTGMTLWAHWLFFVRGKDRRAWLAMLTLPLATVALAGLVVALMESAGVRLARPARRALFRSSVHLPGDTLRAFATYPIELFGPIVLPAALAFAVVLVVRWRARSDGPDDGPRTRQLLACLAASGLLSAGVFGHAFVNHRFLVMYLLPAVAVAAGLALARLVRGWTSPVLRRVVLVGLTALALTSALYANDRLRNLRPDDSEIEGRFQRLQRLAALVKPELRAGDRVLVLGGGRSSSLYLVTAFYELWAPCIDAGARPERWEAELATGTYRLVLATRPEGVDWASAQPGLRALARDGAIAFFATAP